MSLSKEKNNNLPKDYSNYKILDLEKLWIEKVRRFLINWKWEKFIILSKYEFWELKEFIDSAIIKFEVDIEYKKKWKIFCVYVHKWWPWKTTTTFTSLYFLSQMGYNVLWIDWDSQNNLSQHYSKIIKDKYSFKVDELKTVWKIFDWSWIINFSKDLFNIKKELFLIPWWIDWYDIIKNSYSKILKWFEKIWFDENLWIDWVLSSNKDLLNKFLMEINSEYSNSKYREKYFIENMNILKANFDSIFIDLPAAKWIITDNSLSIADYVIVPISTYLSVKWIKWIFTSIFNSEDFNEDVKFIFVLTSWKVRNIYDKNKTNIISKTMSREHMKVIEDLKFLFWQYPDLLKRSYIYDWCIREDSNIKNLFSEQKLPNEIRKTNWVIDYQNFSKYLSKFIN